ncbi:hypothetical protein TN53_11865 [Streptomyces sp. WM6386]|nr:hypothetical protein TN53_11865 [Streptomyces sp. WM6386]
MLAAGSAAALAIGGFAAPPASAADVGALAVIGQFETALGVDTGDIVTGSCQEVPEGTTKADLDSGSILLYGPTDDDCEDTPIGVELEGPGEFPAAQGLHYRAFE